MAKSTANSSHRESVLRSAPIKENKALEQVIDNVVISHPDKILIDKPEMTKEDIARYYLAVSGRMLPYLEERILSTVHCPDGIRGKCYYKRHPDGARGVINVSVPSVKGEAETYYYVSDAYGMLSEVQLDTVEFHTWGSRVKTLEEPDIMVFDLDPDEGLDLGHIRQGVKDLKSILDSLSLVSFLKTSGGKGYHVVIPFKDVPSWDSFHQFAENVAKAMESAWPARYTSEIRKDHRKGKIFVDWLRNIRGATTVAPYSVRAWEGAPVSAPIAWKELDRIRPNGINTTEALARTLVEDPWAAFFDTDQTLEKGALVPG